MKQEHDGSYKIGMSFRSLFLGVAYYPNRDYLYGLPERTHLLLWCSRRGVVRPFEDMGDGEVPIVAKCPVVEGFLANVVHRLEGEMEPYRELRERTANRQAVVPPRKI